MTRGGSFLKEKMLPKGTAGETKAFLKEKMMPLMPAFGVGRGCKRYSRRRERLLESDNDFGKSRERNKNGRGGEGGGSTVGGDSTTYFSEDDDDDASSSFYSSEDDSDRSSSTRRSSRGDGFDDGDAGSRRGGRYDGEHDDVYYSGSSDDNDDGQDGRYLSEDEGASDDDCSYASDVSRAGSSSSRLPCAPGRRSSTGKQPDADDDYGDDELCRSSRSERSRQQHARLLEENETLRSSVVALRSDFEAMLEKMNSAMEAEEEDGGEGSISTDDDSRASHCLRRIEDARRSVTERLTAAERERGEKIERREDKRKYKECIDDLLSENERLYEKIVTLSQEREEILQEVRDLRDNDGGAIGGAVAVDSLKNDGATAAVTDNEDDDQGSLMLTDESVALSHNKAINDIASLIDGIAKDNDTEKDKADTMGEEILSLVSKILSQREIVLDAKKETDGDDEKIPNGATKTTNADKGKVFDRDDDDRDKGGERSQEAGPRRPSERSSQDRILESQDQNCESFSVCTVNSSSSSIDNGKEVSSNSLFDGTTPSVVDSRGLSRGRGDDDGNDDDDDDDDGALEIIYEYYSSDSGDEGSFGKRSGSGSRRRTSMASASTAYHEYDKGHHNDDQDYDAHYQDEDDKTEYYSDEDVERPPQGYHWYSTTSRHSSSRSRSRSASHRSSSDASSEESGSSRMSALLRRYRRVRSCKSVHSHYSSHAPPSPEERIDIASSKTAVKTKGDNSLKVRELIDEDHIISMKSSEEFDYDDGESQTTQDEIKIDPKEQALAHAIESRLDSPFLAKKQSLATARSCCVDNFDNMPSVACASMSASTSSMDDDARSRPSCSSSSSSIGESTRERKGICITVVSRSSRHISFPSSQSHTYVTFFRAAMSKNQVDAVLEEQFQETREVLEDSIATALQTNCSTASRKKKKKKKYQGEYNERHERHGYGIYTSGNRNEYRGEWQNDKREGLGVVRIGNGDVFEGQFERNFKNGIGVYHYKDGECDLSRYKDDARVGDSLRYSKDRKSAFLILSSGDSSARAISLEDASEVAKGMGTVVAY